MIPAKTWANEFPDGAELYQFINDVNEAFVSAHAKDLFTALAAMPSPDRLSHNLCVFAGLIPRVQVWRDILVDGLTDEERTALCELDASTLSVRAREIAHGLLNLHSRWLVMRALKGTLTDAQRHHREYLA